MSRTKTVESPCVRRCCLSDDDVCLGCFRTLTEILNWLKSTDDQRRDVCRLAKEREALSPSPFHR
jgi:uncharacterized protein